MTEPVERAREQLRQATWRHDETASEREERRDASRGQAWCYSAAAEEMVRQVNADGASFDRTVAPRGRVTVGMYLESKAAAERAGIDTSDPERST